MTAQMLQQSTYAPFGNLGTNLFGPPLQYPHHMRFKNHDHRQLRDRAMPTLEPFRSPCSAKWNLLALTFEFPGKVPGGCEEEEAAPPMNSRSTCP